MTTELKSNFLGRVFAAHYMHVPFRDHILRLVVRTEGGQFRSASLRRVLHKHYDISVGAHSYGSLLIPGMCDSKTSIGRYVSIGPNVRRFGASHPITMPTMHPYWYNSDLGWVPKSNDVRRSALVIESEAWIGANATILPGCKRIGIGAVVGAASVVTKDVPDFAIVVGNPARQLSVRLSDVVRKQLLSARPWDFAPERAAEIFSEITNPVV